MTFFFDWIKKLFGGQPSTILWIGSLPGTPGGSNMGSGSGSAADILRQVQQFLAEARKALASKDFDEAEKNLNEADQLIMKLPFGDDKSLVQAERTRLRHELFAARQKR